MSQDTSPSGITDAARHALMLGRGHLQKITDWDNGLREGYAVLELGPGPNFGSVAYLACFGARPAAADRWIAIWDPSYHPLVYDRMAEILAIEEPSTNTSALSALASAGQHCAPLMPTYQAAETLEGVLDNSMDAVVSNAVLEHVEDEAAVAQAIYRVTKPGGISIHQIDLRDHRDFSQPLEYLLLSQVQLTKWLKETGTHAGHPRRRSVYEAAFVSAGFEILCADVNEKLDTMYRLEFEPRLRATTSSAWQNCDGSDLSDIGICLIMRKPT
jgi:SAM-dependent methyltransferase